MPQTSPVGVDRVDIAAAPHLEDEPPLQLGGRRRARRGRGDRWLGRRGRRRGHRRRRGGSGGRHGRPGGRISSDGGR
ncbi:MAG TPA: hypothetical protein ENO24_06650 [Chloroflexi bacterium]|nr:hypothetical protein [Chloroflexota bacterium]